jgi:hypothetical protein
MKQKLINGLVILSVLAMGAGLGLPGFVKWRSQQVLSTWDDAVLVIGITVMAWGAVCGVRLVYQSFVSKVRPSN